MCGARKKLNSIDLRVLLEFSTILDIVCAITPPLRRAPRSQETLPHGGRLIPRTILYVSTIPVLWARIAELCTECFHVQDLPMCRYG